MGPVYTTGTWPTAAFEQGWDRSKKSVPVRTVMRGWSTMFSNQAP